MKIAAILVVIFILEFRIITARSSRFCRLKNRISPCHCKEGQYGKGIRITCEEIKSPEDLENELKYFDNCQIYSFTLRRSILAYLPGELFVDRNLQELHFVDVTFMKLSQNGHNENVSHIFKGTEESLQKISITTNSFDYRLAELHVELKKLKELNIVTGEMPHIEYLSGFAPNVEKLVIDQQNAKDINETAFSKMLRLKELKVTRNQITSIKRQMLPRPAKELNYIDLRSNLLYSLPSDAFEEMPLLNILILQDNKLHTLEEKTMKPVWRYLRVFSLEGNMIRCDERTEWMVTSNTSSKGQLSWGTCWSPPKFKDRDLEDWSMKKYENIEED